MDAQRPWHRLFGLSLIDFFRGQPVTVELEKDLSLKQQLLDVVILRKGPEPLSCRLPDGLEELAPHNLLTFKSFQETLDGWTLQELLGHYVNYRKQVSPSMNDLLPEADFRLFAVCVRDPQVLAQQTRLQPVRSGVFDVAAFTHTIRVVVVHRLPQQEQNALLHLFSARDDLLQYGTTHYRQRSSETSSILRQLFQRYREEVDLMPDLLEEFTRQTIDELLHSMSLEERLKWLTVEERLTGLPAEERLKGLPAEERLKGLPAEERLKGLPAEERLKGLSKEEIVAALPPEILADILRQGKAPPA